MHCTVTHRFVLTLIMLHECAAFDADAHRRAEHDMYHKEEVNTAFAQLFGDDDTDEPDYCEDCGRLRCICASADDRYQEALEWQWHARELAERD